jgi:hypothetical protein
MYRIRPLVKPSNANSVAAAFSSPEVNLRLWLQRDRDRKPDQRLLPKIPTMFSLASI